MQGNTKSRSANHTHESYPRIIPRIYTWIILYIYIYIFIHGYNMYVYEFVWIFNVSVGSWTDVAPRTQRITAAGYPLPEPRDSWLQTHAAEVHRPFIRGCSARGIHPQLSPHIPMLSLISILISIQSELCTSPLFVFPTFRVLRCAAGDITVKWACEPAVLLCFQHTFHYISLHLYQHLYLVFQIWVFHDFIVM